MFENSESYLGGKVRKMSLPQVSLPVPAGSPPLKRLMLAQGELAQFYDAEEGIRYLAWIELEPGQVRGNHYHRQKREYIYVLAGETDLLARSLNGQESATLRLRPGDLALVAPEVAHALRPAASGSAVEFSPERFDSQDIFKHAVC